MYLFVFRQHQHLRLIETFIVQILHRNAILSTTSILVGTLMRLLFNVTYIWVDTVSA